LKEFLFINIFEVIGSAYAAQPAIAIVSAYA
jgi:hypothetical protein